MSFRLKVTSSARPQRVVQLARFGPGHNRQAETARFSAADQVPESLAGPAGSQVAENIQQAAHHGRPLPDVAGLPGWFALPDDGKAAFAEQRDRWRGKVDRPAPPASAAGIDSDESSPDEGQPQGQGEQSARQPLRMDTAPPTPPEVERSRPYDDQRARADFPELYRLWVETKGEAAAESPQLLDADTSDLGSESEPDEAQSEHEEFREEDEEDQGSLYEGLDARAAAYLRELQAAEGRGEEPPDPDAWFGYGADEDEVSENIPTDAQEARRDAVSVKEPEVKRSGAVPADEFVPVAIDFEALSSESAEA